MFKKKEYKKFIKKLDDNLYEITGDVDVLRSFFKDCFTGRVDKEGKRDVVWNLEEFMYNSSLHSNVIVSPFDFEIRGTKDMIHHSIRQFVYKDSMSDDIRGNGLSDYGNYYKQITLKFEFPEKIGFIKTGLINIISVSYKGLNDTVEVECINNIPQYWKYPDSFELFVSEGDCFYSDDENLKRKLWTDNGDGIYSGYIKDISYGELCYYSYDRIGDFIFNKWSNAYQAITDIKTARIFTLLTKNIRLQALSQIYVLQRNIFCMVQAMELRKGLMSGKIILSVVLLNIMLMMTNLFFLIK